MKQRALETIEAFSFCLFLMVSLAGWYIWTQASNFIYVKSQAPITARLYNEQIIYKRGSPSGYRYDIEYVYDGNRRETSCKSFFVSSTKIEGGFAKIVPREGSCYYPYLYIEDFEIPEIMPLIVVSLSAAEILLLISVLEHCRRQRRRRPDVNRSSA